MHMRTLYKRTSTGAIQEWHREIDGNKYRSVSGQIDGSKVESGWTVAQPKNEGKSNATTAEQQAQIECDAAYVKKLAQGGYHETIDGIDSPKFFKPMLAKSYDDYPVTSFTNVFSQPKLDGVRCIATIDGLWSRQGKPIDAVPHISDALAPFFEKNPDAILDGELYADKLAQDFNKIISLVRKVNPSAERLAEAAEIVEYHIYDYPSWDGTFASRYVALCDATLGAIDPMIKLVETATVGSQEHLDELNGAYLEAGYEGQMVRINNAGYENKRSKQLLKRKVFEDREFTVVEIVEGGGNRSGMAGYVTYELGDGRTFGSGIKGSHDYCRELLRDKDRYAGGTGTVKFFALTPDGVPRFPVTVALYDGKRDV